MWLHFLLKIEKRMYINWYEWIELAKQNANTTKSESVKVWEDVGLELEKRRDSINELFLLLLLLLLRGWFAWVRVLL